MSTANDLPKIRETYLENADYDVANSTAKCQAFIVAGRKLMLLLPSEGQTGGTGGELFRLNTGQVQEELRRAELWLAAKGQGPKYFDLSCFRE